MAGPSHELILPPQPDGGACFLDVRVQPRASRSGPVGTWNGALKVALCSPAEDGRANRELVRALASALGVRPAEIHIQSGARSRMKRVRIARPCAQVHPVLAGILRALRDSKESNDALP